MAAARSSPVLPDRVIHIAGGPARVEPELWRFLGLAADGTVPEILPAGPIAVPLAAWKGRRADFLARREPVGVWLVPGDDPAELAPDLDTLALVAIQFPKFTDGRGYSTAVLLRTRLGYRGELRAFGDVGRDQLFYLKRSGFDAFSLAPHRDPESALASLSDFSVRYQGSVDDPLPLFRRRHAAGVAK
jgi:uncharacterized protein (DUF934 family)